MKKELKKLIKKLSPMNKVKFQRYLQQGKGPRLHAALFRGLLRRQTLKNIRDYCKKLRSKPTAQNAADDRGGSRYLKLLPYNTISLEHINYLNTWENSAN